MLVHSCIYYELDENLISDAQWSAWAVELAELQDTYPELAKSVKWHRYFEDWDGSSGAFLPLRHPWVAGTAEMILRISKNKT